MRLTGNGVTIGVVEFDVMLALLYPAEILFPDFTVHTFTFGQQLRTPEDFDKEVGAKGLSILNAFLKLTSFRLRQITSEVTTRGVTTRGVTTRRVKEITNYDPSQERLEKLKSYAQHDHVNLLKQGIIPSEWEHSLSVIRVIHSVAPNAKIILITLCEESEEDMAMLQGFLKIEKQLKADGATIVNYSLSFSLPEVGRLPPDTLPRTSEQSETLQKYLVPYLASISNSPILHIAAAGNRRQHTHIRFPAIYPAVLTVGAAENVEQQTSIWKVTPYSLANRNGIFAPLSGRKIVKPNVTAPVINLERSLGVGEARITRETIQTGTSFAAPYVAGLAALLKEKYPNFTRENLASALVSTANPYILDSPIYTTGSGLVDPFRALNPSILFDQTSLTLTKNLTKVATEYSSMIEIQNLTAAPIKFEMKIFSHRAGYRLLPLRADLLMIGTIGNEPLTTIPPRDKVLGKLIVGNLSIEKLAPVSLLAFFFKRPDNLPEVLFLPFVID